MKNYLKDKRISNAAIKIVKGNSVSFAKLILLTLDSIYEVDNKSCKSTDISSFQAG